MTLESVVSTCTVWKCDVVIAVDDIRAELVTMLTASLAGTV